METEDQSATQKPNGGPTTERAVALTRQMRERLMLLKQRVERPSDVWRLFKEQPALGVGIAVGIGLSLATIIGAAETAVALGAGLLAYEALGRPSPFSNQIDGSQKN